MDILERVVRIEERGISRDEWQKRVDKRICSMDAKLDTLITEVADARTAIRMSSGLLAYLLRMLTPASLGAAAAWIASKFLTP